MPDYRRSLAEFERRYGPGGQIGVARAPYRVCPLGAHTDHQRGLVIGFTVEPAIRVVFRPRGDRRVRAASREFPSEDVEFETGESGGRRGGYGDYLDAVASALDREVTLRVGVDAWIEGDLQPGGVASSAALEVAFLLALAHANGVSIERAAAMRLVARAEARGVGVHVGLLDPAVILFGEAGHLVYLDCDEGTPRAQRLAARLPPFEFVIIDAGGARKLRESAYNVRVAECREAARALGAQGDPPALREITLEHLRRNRAKIDPTLARRAEHVLSENKRVKNGVAALQQGDLRSFGALVNASGRSMIKLFDAGTPETTRVLDLLERDPGVIGATLNGAGFGGSVLAIAAEGAGAAVARRVLEALTSGSHEGQPCNATVCGIGAGASVVS